MPIVVNLQIVRAKDGKVYARLRWKNQVEPYTIGWTTPTLAESERVRVEACLRAGVPPTSSPGASANGPTVLDVLGAYTDDLEARKVGGEGYRANVLSRGVHLGVHLGSLLAASLTTRDLEQYVATRQREPGGRRGNRAPHKATVRDELLLLRRACERARKEGKIAPAFPALPSMRGWPDDAKPARRLDEAELRRLVDVAAEDRPALANLVTFAAWCPRRPIAIFALTRYACRRALDPAYKGKDVLWIARDKGQRAIGWSPLLRPARRALQDHLRDTIGPPDAPVWTTPTGLLYGSHHFYEALGDLSTKAGIERVTPYDLRKFGAVAAYRATGRSIKTTMNFTGHSTAATLIKHYLYDEEDAVLRAMEEADWSVPDAARTNADDS